MLHLHSFDLLMKPRRHSETEIARQKSIWETLGKEDPFWAVASWPERRGGRWDLEAFLATGEADLQRYREILRRRANAPEDFRHVLDFGCGVGRLTRLWAQHATHVTGVDISGPMLEQAQRIAGHLPGVAFVLNDAENLQSLGTTEFDLVFSHICLQHMPWSLAHGYIREFARVCQRSGWVVFQLPARPAPTVHIQLWRRRLVEALPFGLGAIWRRWRHGSSVIFDVCYTPPEIVRQAAAEGGLEFVYAEPNADAGTGTEGFIYLFRKP